MQLQPFQRLIGRLYMQLYPEESSAGLDSVESRLRQYTEKRRPVMTKKKDHRKVYSREFKLQALEMAEARGHRT
jgi:hypothetical protein